MSVSAGEVEEDGLKVEGEEGVVRIGMGAQQLLHQSRQLEGLKHASTGPTGSSVPGTF